VRKYFYTSLIVALSLCLANLAKADEQIERMIRNLKYADSLYLTWDTKETIEKDLKKGNLKINHKESSSGNTLLHVAIKKGFVEIVKILLQHPKIDVDIPNKNSTTPLEMVFWSEYSYNHSALVGLLSSYIKVDTKKQDGRSQTLLVHAIRESTDTYLIEKLLHKRKLDRIKPKDSNKRFLSAAFFIDQRNKEKKREEVITKSLEEAIFSQACTIITTGSTLHDLLFLLPSEKKDDFQQYRKSYASLTNKLLKMHNFYAVAKQTNETESDTPFVCVIIPHAYEEKVMDDWKSCKKHWRGNRDGLTDRDIALGINFSNLKKLSTKAELEKFCLNKKNPYSYFSYEKPLQDKPSDNKKWHRDNKAFLKALSRVFVQRKKIPTKILKRIPPKKLAKFAKDHFDIEAKDYPSLIAKLERPPCGGIWNFYQIGHGNMEIIADLSPAKYQKELAFFRDKIDTNILISDTCYKQSHVFSAYQQTDKMDHIKTNFTIVNNCATDSPIIRRHYNFSRLFSNLEKQAFFSGKTKKQPNLEKTMREALTHSWGLQPRMSTVPFVRYPNSIYFIPLQNVDPKVEYLTNAKIKNIELSIDRKYKRHQKNFEEKRSEMLKELYKKGLIPNTKDILFISPSRIAVPLKLEFTPNILSTFPGNAIHLLEEVDISSLDQTLKDFIHSAFFKPATTIELKTQKIFIIKTIKHSKGVDNNIIVVINSGDGKEPNKIVDTNHFAQLEKIINSSPTSFYDPTTRWRTIKKDFYHKERIAIPSKSARKPMFVQPFLAGQKTYDQEILNFVDTTQNYMSKKTQSILDENKITTWDLFWANFGMVDPKQFSMLQKVPNLESRNARDLQIRVETFLQKSKSILFTSIETMKKHLEQLSNINGKDKNEETILHKAAKEGTPEVVQFLLERGAYIETPNKAGLKPADLAKREDVRELLSEITTILTKEYDNEKKVIETLKKYQFLPKVKTEANGYITHIATRNGELKTVIALLEHGVSFKGKDFIASTPLHWAVGFFAEDIKILKALLKHPDKIDLNAKNHHGKTAYDLAKRGGDKEEIALLEKAMSAEKEEYD